jgi:hypothetical protein
VQEGIGDKPYRDQNKAVFDKDEAWEYAQELLSEVSDRWVRYELPTVSGFNDEMHQQGFDLVGETTEEPEKGVTREMHVRTIIAGFQKLCPIAKHFPSVEVETMQLVKLA